MDPTKTDSKSEILFKPITEGLGFHPFSDGLPYAPIAKGPKIHPPTETQGGPFGAQVAGPAQFITRSIPSRVSSPAPQISVPVAKVPVQEISPSLSEKLAASARNAGAPPVNGSFGFAYSVKRVFAYFLDMTINGILFAAALGSFVIKQDFNLEVLMNPSVILLLALVFGFANWFFISFQEIFFKTSLGKRIFGLGLYGSGTQRFLRALFFIPSIGFFGLGILFSLFDRKKRCWHDRLVNLQPNLF